MSDVDWKGWHLDERPGIATRWRYAWWLDCSGADIPCGYLCEGCAEAGCEAKRTRNPTALFATARVNSDASGLQPPPLLTEQCECCRRYPESEVDLLADAVLP